VTTPADLVREACGLLAGYMGTLERLVAEPATRGGTGSTGYVSVRVAETPEPWNAPAGRALMDAHEGARRLEAVLRYALHGHPGQRRGGSTGNTLAALDAIPRLAAGLDTDAEALAARIVERWVNEARSVPAIDEAQRWRYVQGRRCPYCKCGSLKVALDARNQPAGRVECHSHPSVGCRDGNGRRPAATMGTSGRGEPELRWDDGLTETVPDLTVET
jgi:hypothetical protein